MTRTIRGRLVLLEAARGEPEHGGLATQAFLRWCLESDGLDPDNLPTLTDKEQRWVAMVLAASWEHSVEIQQ